MAQETKTNKKEAAMENSMQGSFNILLFLLLLMLLFWGFNAYKHYKKGWTKFQKSVDIIGGIFIAALFVGMLLPMMKK